MSLQKLLSLVVHDGDASDTSPLVTGVALTALVFGTSRRTSIASRAAFFFGLFKHLFLFFALVHLGRPAFVTLKAAAKCSAVIFKASGISFESAN
ncbi:hypothetical protein V6N12_074129 [Hibiscus sabdariffa]|uniref:Uncharacterized protein n=1 Tax=Hibiscus sabdariffa TaxID=183260 RepID=A0ABR2BFW5_9ROSI